MKIPSVQAIKTAANTLIRGTKSSSILKDASSAAERTNFSFASTGSEKAAQYTVREHGLSEIMVDSMHKPSQLTQCVVDSPAIRRAPDYPHIVVEGEYIEIPKGSSGLAVSHKITTSEDGLYKYVQFYDKEGLKVDARVKVEITRPMSRKEHLQYLKDLKDGKIKKPEKKPTKVKPLVPNDINYRGFRIPEGTTYRTDIKLPNGNQVITFMDGSKRPIRKIILDKSGKAIEYSDFNFEINPSIRGGHGQITYTWDANNKSIMDESQSYYSEIKRESRYILNSRGGVKKSIQTWTSTPHIAGKIEEPLTTTVESRAMTDGNWWEDVEIKQGDKQFRRSFIFHGNTRYQMDGWCKNLSKNEIEMIKSDPFLASRYFNIPADVIKAEKYNAYKMQNLRDKATPITFSPPHSIEAGYYKRYKKGLYRNISDGYINITENTLNPNGINGISRKLNTLHHEANHGRQHDMIDALNNGTISSANREEAEKLRYALEHYVSIDDNFDAYYNNYMEIDSRRAGETAEKLFKENGKKIQQIFYQN